ncbi:MAG: glutamine synthetase III [Bacteroidales bacterium]|jgi:glutamine synthetase|nr:glutamine synthetase III [Bacteroidales bacterium]
MGNIRQKALEESASHGAERFHEEKGPVSEYFGKNVFDLEKMKRYLSKEAYNAVVNAVEFGQKIEVEVADQIAIGMKNWAVEMGASHYTHWFQPLTDATAEKHESFISPLPNGGVFEKFSGSTLIQQEPDASSFPSGGLRNTFEARGYTAWDPSSPAFVLDGTLCIPTVFVAYNGESLDLKTPHLKSLQALNQTALDICKLFDKDVTRVNAVLGIEQEYFLVDESLYKARPDLVICDRTLIGHTAAKDQQLEDNYFGAIPNRVMDFMKDFETEAYKLGVKLKTRHNEVAPNQFEFAPIFGEANLSSDQNLLMMILMKKIAGRHHLKVIFHEKPFNGVNGSGKHCNWSMFTDTGIDLLAPGKTPKANLQFLCFFSSVIRAVYEHNQLLMSSVASLSNMYRLGGNEAPPAVMSIFLGETLTELLDSIEKLSPDNLSSLTGKDVKVRSKLHIVNQIPEIFPDNTDRNRTSPFAFTGNRFEFRAVGSSSNVASSIYVLNSIVAQQLKRFKTLVEEAKASGLSQDKAMMKTIRQFVIESKKIRFEGNGYSREWAEEAEKRGLKGITSAPMAYEQYITDKTMALFDDEGIFTRREALARFEVMNENYVKKLQIEARVMGDLATNHVVPTAITFQNKLLENVMNMKEIYPEKYHELCKTQIRMIEKISGYINRIHEGVHNLVEARKVANKIEDIHKKAIAYNDTVKPHMEDIRRAADKLEMVIDDELWPLPKYRELLSFK